MRELCGKHQYGSPRLASFYIEGTSRFVWAAKLSAGFEEMKKNYQVRVACAERGSDYYGQPTVQPVPQITHTYNERETRRETLSWDVNDNANKALAELLTDVVVQTYSPPKKRLRTRNIYTDFVKDGLRPSAQHSL
jgi:hypothetical protein